MKNHGSTGGLRDSVLDNALNRINRNQKGLITETRNLERAAPALATREHEIFLFFRVFVLSCFRDRKVFL